MDVYLTYLGCRLNESEIEELAWRFTVQGHRIVDAPEEAQLCVVNTCTVTGEAGRKSRQLVRRLARANPGVQIAITGCHATIAPEQMARLPNVTHVVSNADKERLVERVLPSAAEVGAPFEQDPVVHRLEPGRLGRTRAFVKVQDGCDNRCTFCITTIARGPGVSRPREGVVQEVQGLVAGGYREVVLTGVHLGSYGRDRDEPDGLYRLVADLLERTDVPRLRLSSLEPWELSPSFFTLWSDQRLCRQLHLPLQSGSDAVLRRMARRTTTADFRNLVEAARERIPDLALTSDVIVSFPGETDAQFQESYDYVAALGFARLHVFTYSPRPGTAAARMAGRVPGPVQAARGRAMRRLGARQAQAFHRRFLGRTLPVLWERARDDGVWRGHTDNYLNVTTACGANLTNRITQTRMLRAEGAELRGEVIGSS